MLHLFLTVFWGVCFWDSRLAWLITRTLSLSGYFRIYKPNIACLNCRFAWRIFESIKAKTSKRKGSPGTGHLPKVTHHNPNITGVTSNFKWDSNHLYWKAGVCSGRGVWRSRRASSGGRRSGERKHSRLLQRFFPSTSSLPSRTCLLNISIYDDTHLLLFPKSGQFPSTNYCTLGCLYIVLETNCTGAGSDGPLHTASLQILRPFWFPGHAQLVPL